MFWVKLLRFAVRYFTTKDVIRRHAIYSLFTVFCRRHFHLLQYKLRSKNKALFYITLLRHASFLGTKLSLRRNIYYTIQGAKASESFCFIVSVLIMTSLWPICLQIKIGTSTTTSKLNKKMFVEQVV